MPVGAARDPGFVQRVFGLRRDEYAAVAWSFLYFFCVLASYYMMRSVREAMAVESGVRNIPWLFSAAFVVMLLIAPVFGWIASHYPRKRFLPWVYAFFAANIVAFYVAFTYVRAQGTDIVWVGRVFFVWLSVFNLFVVSVFWSFMADIYTREQGRRLFGLISAGGSMGALLGPLLTSVLVVRVGFANLLPIAALLLLTSVVFIGRLRRWVERREGADAANNVASARPLGGDALGGIEHVLRSPFLLTIALATVLASLMGNALYILMASLVEQAFASTDERTRTFALLDAAQNAIALTGQLLLVKHAVQRLGVGVTLALMPALSLIGFALVVMHPTFAVVAALQVVRRGVGFGFTKPTTDMLYSVVTPEEKYKSKNFIETAVYRGGDLIGTWTARFLSGLGVAGVAAVMIPFAALWTGAALWLGRRYRRLADDVNAAP